MSASPGTTLRRLREEKPLVHNITNYVVMNETANAILAVGALPVMAHAGEEVEEMVGLAGALVLNIGTLSPPWVEAMVLAARMARERAIPIVLDPVMVAESGATLLDPDARAALRDLLIPRAAVVTPNLPEARTLVGDDSADGEALARAVHALGPAAVVITGGHRDVATDLFYDGTELVPIEGERHPGGAAHGSGCTHSSVLAAHLALGFEPLESARAAKRIASDAVRDGLRGLGAGAGPVDVFGLAQRHRS